MKLAITGSRKINHIPDEILDLNKCLSCFEKCNYLTVMKVMSENEKLKEENKKLKEFIKNSGERYE